MTQIVENRMERILAILALYTLEEFLAYCA
jgi:hypothetical protein